METQPYGNLAYDLANGTGSRRHENHISFLGLSDFQQRAVGRHTRHAQRAQMCRQGDTRSRSDDIGPLSLGLIHERVRLGGMTPEEGQAALGEFWVVAFQDFTDDLDGDDGFTWCHGGTVGFYAEVSHAASLAGIVRGIQVFGGEAPFGSGCGLVKGDVLDGQIFACNWPAIGHGLVHECFVGDHFWGDFVLVSCFLVGMNRYYRQKYRVLDMRFGGGTVQVVIQERELYNNGNGVNTDLATVVDVGE